MTEQKTKAKKKKNRIKKIREEPNPVHRSHSNVTFEFHTDWPVIENFAVT